MEYKHKTPGKFASDSVQLDKGPPVSAAYAQQKLHPIESQASTQFVLNKEKLAL